MRIILDVEHPVFARAELGGLRLASALGRLIRTVRGYAVSERVPLLLRLVAASDDQSREFFDAMEILTGLCMDLGDDSAPIIVRAMENILIENPGVRAQFLARMVLNQLEYNASHPDEVAACIAECEHELER